MKKQLLTSKLLLSGILLMLVSPYVFAMSPDDILGVWDNESKEAKIEIYKCMEKFCGKIVSLKHPDYLPDSKDGVPGTPRLDHNNPIPKLTSKPLLGLEIMQDLVYTGNDIWKDGRVYDPKNGYTYTGKVMLVSKNELKLRGYIGFAFFGRTEIWTR